MSKEDLKIAVKQIENEAKAEAEYPNVPISVTMITRDDPKGLKRCLESLHPILLCTGDEICVLDTGSDEYNQGENKRVVREIGGNYHYENLICNIDRHVKEWLPEFYDTYKDSYLANGCILSFADARQKCSELAKHPVQIWIDTDDTMVEKQPGQLRWTINRLFSEKGLNGRGADSLFLEYKYAFDKSDGSCITTLKRERIVDTSVYEWKGRCHETLIPKNNSWKDIRGAGFLQDLTTFIVHHKVEDDHRLTDIRNYIIMRNEIEECKAAGKCIDPRTIFYLGNACRGLGKDGDALEYYDELYQSSGSMDDRWLSKYYSGMIWINDKNRRPLDGLDCFLACLKLRPDDRRAYFAISRCYYALGRFELAIQFFQQGINMKPLPVNLHADDPQHSDLMPYQIAAMSARETGDHGFAKKCAELMHEKYPEHKLTQAVITTLQNDEAKSGLVDGVMRIVANEVGPDRQAGFKETRERVLKHFELLDGVPDELEDQGFSPLEPARDIDPDKEIIFLCGTSVEAFGPSSTGLGGSEKMICAMAPKLQALGYQVSVYCKCPRDDRGMDESTGVYWWHWGGIDTKKQRGTIIYWRSPELLELPIPAKKRIVWCHDVQDPSRWTDIRIALANQVWMLSEYHKTTLGDKVIEKLGDKVKITRNGIDVEVYAPDKDIVRKPKKILYASSPDRGVKSAIQVFQRAKEVNPTAMEGAELHIFYGFNKLFLKHVADSEYRHIPDIGRDASGWEYMQSVHHLVDSDPDIHWRGRVSWGEMAREQLEAGVWLYPTRFPEISCMAAMEAQAAGCKVVASDYAALAETVEWGMPIMAYKVDPDDIDDAARQLARACAEPASGEDRRLMAHVARNSFSFESLAEEWETLIKQ
jgi:glycosyltransferase involved in cell wall biosynthesis